MGLLANLDKKKKSSSDSRSTNLSDAALVSKEGISGPTVAAPDVSYKKLGPDSMAAIRVNMEEQIKNDEHPLVNKPTAAMIDNKLVVLRPEGSLDKLGVTDYISSKNMKSESEPLSDGLFDFRRIKNAIESKMKSESGNSSSSFSESKTFSKDRIASGILGLDGVMDGGFRKNSVSLIAGGPGSGKTIFGMQFLVNGVDQFNESGVYISFEQTEAEIIKDMAAFNWSLEEKIKNKKLVILAYTPEQVEKVLSTGGGTVRDVIESIGAKRIVVDSLSAFTLLHDDQLAQRKSCIALFESIKKWDCTALLISEKIHLPDEHKSEVEEFEVDGVILLYNIRRGDVRERALEIFKMRATKHSQKIFPITISNKGIEVFPDHTIF